MAQMMKNHIGTKRIYFANMIKSGKQHNRFLSYEKHLETTCKQGNNNI